MMFKLLTVSLLAASSLASPLDLTGSLLRRNGAVPQLIGGSVAMSPNGTGTYPRSTNIMAAGVMIGAYALYTEGSDNESILKSVKSTNGGASWAPLGEVFRGNVATHDIDNGFPIVLPSGRVLYFYRNHDRKPDGTYTYFRISVSYSDDGGVNFKYLSTVDERVPNGVNGLWEPFVRFMNDGKTLQCYYAAENNAGDQDILAKTSTDGGSTWSSFYGVSGSTVTARDGMPGVAPIDNNGNLIAVYETNENNGRFVVNSVTSSDDGKTWGNRRRVYTPIGANVNKNAGAPQVWNIYGTLVVSFMTDEDRDSTTGYANQACKILVSSDGGNTWGHKTTVFPTGGNWPGMAFLSPNQVLVMSEVDGTGVRAQRVQFN